MFKKTFFLSVFLLIAAPSFCQIYTGLSAGTSFTHYASGANGGSVQYKTLRGISLNVPLVYKLNSHLAFHSGLSFYTSGSRQRFATSGYNTVDANDPVYQSIYTSYGDFYEAAYRFHYLSIPLTITVSVPLNAYSLYGRVGGYFSYAVNGTYSDNNRYDDSQHSIHFSEGHLNRTDVGALLGLGMTREVGKGYVFLEGTYMLGFADINKRTGSENNFYILPDKAFNRGLFVNLGYMIRLPSND